MTFDLSKLYSYQGKTVAYKGDNVFKTFQDIATKEVYYLEPDQEALVTEYKEPVAKATK